jgi:hypothetical protein
VAEFGGTHLVEELVGCGLRAGGRLRDEVLVCQVEGTEAAVAVAAVGTGVAGEVEGVDLVQLRPAEPPGFQERLVGMLHDRAGEDLASDVGG